MLWFTDAETVAAVYDRRLSQITISGGHRPPLQIQPLQCCPDFLASAIFTCATCMIIGVFRVIRARYRYSIRNFLPSGVRSYCRRRAVCTRASAMVRTSDAALVDRQTKRGSHLFYESRISPDYLRFALCRDPRLKFLRSDPLLSVRIHTALLRHGFSAPPVSPPA